MKRAIAILLVIAASIFAQDQTSLNERPDKSFHKHRGLYFSEGLTVAYSYTRHLSCTIGCKYMQESKMSGFLHPYEEIRLGASIANIISLYAALGAGIGTAHYEFVENYEDDEELNENIDSYDMLLKFLFGGGVEFYPIRDQFSPIYGSFIGLTVGISIDMALDHHDFIYSFIRFEVGKDWWFSRRWSYGFAFNYTLGDTTSEIDNERDSYRNHTIGLTFRLSH